MAQVDCCVNILNIATNWEFHHLEVHTTALCTCNTFICKLTELSIFLCHIFLWRAVRSAVEYQTLTRESLGSNPIFCCFFAWVFSFSPRSLHVLSGHSAVSINEYLPGYRPGGTSEWMAFAAPNNQWIYSVFLLLPGCWGMASLRSNHSASSQGSHFSPRSRERTSPSFSSHSHGSYTERNVGKLVSGRKLSITRNLFVI